MQSVKWTDAALRDLAVVDSVIAQRIVQKVSWLELHFNLVVPEMLSGPLKGYYKLRVGDFRVIYSVQKQLVIVEAVRHRREVYKE